MIDTIVRAWKGAVRSPLRTTLVIALLAVGLSFALTSVALALAAEDELDKVKATTGVEASITINPNQFRAAIQEQLEQADEDGVDLDIGDITSQVETLTPADAEAIEALPYVRNAEGFAVAPVSYALPGQEDSADEEPEPELPEVEIPEGQPGAGGAVRLGGFTPPDATLTGTDDPAFLSDFQDGTKSLADGRLFGPEDEGQNVVVIDENTATLEGLSVGDVVTVSSVAVFRGPGADDEEEVVAPEIEAEIIGIHQDLETASEGGFGFTIEEWYAPLGVVRQLQRRRR